MHELALCRSLYRIVRRAVPNRTVVAIDLDVGVLRQVVVPTLVHCWGIVTAETPLQGSDLRVRDIPGAVLCAACGRRSELFEQFRLVCAACGDRCVRVVSGEEFLVRSVDVARAKD